MPQDRTRVWLRRELGKSDNGHYQFAGDGGGERIVVVIDPTIIARLGPNKEKDLLALHRKIEKAATTKLKAQEAYPVHPYGRSDERHLLIALTDQDICLGE